MGCWFDSLLLSTSTSAVSAAVGCLVVAVGGCEAEEIDGGRGRVEEKSVAVAVIEGGGGVGRCRKMREGCFHTIRC